MKALTTLDIVSLATIHHTTSAIWRFSEVTMMFMVGVRMRNTYGGGMDTLEMEP